MKLLNKIILLTGGGGFIGSHLAKRLQDEAKKLIIVDNFSTGEKKKTPKNCKLVKGNILNPKTLEKVSTPDMVFHFASPSSVILFHRKPDKCICETVIGFRRVFEWGKERGVEKIIYPSSGSVYGDIPIPNSERDKVQPINLYGMSKLMCEQIARKYSSFIPNVGLRIFAGYGPGEKHKEEISSVISLFLRKMLRGESPVVFGDGKQKRDFIYIDDVVEGILQAAKKCTGIINLGSGNSFTFNNIIRIMNEVLGKEIEPQYVEKPRNYLDTTLADTKKMKEELQLHPRGLKEGIKDYIRKINEK